MARGAHQLFRSCSLALFLPSCSRASKYTLLDRTAASSYDRTNTPLTYSHRSTTASPSPAPTGVRYTRQRSEHHLQLRGISSSKAESSAMLSREPGRARNAFRLLLPRTTSRNETTESAPAWLLFWDVKRAMAWSTTSLLPCSLAPPLARKK